MKKNYNAVADVRVNETLEITRRLHKSITDVSKRLDDQKSRALTTTDLFTPSNEALRVKLKDYCVRLITKDPIGHARKTEELLWRKAFYDTVYAAKKLRKSNAWSETEKALLSIHLAVGIGFYHHLILKLQSEYDLNLLGAIDFAFMQNATESSHAKNNSGRPKIQAGDTKQCVVRLIHRSLVCLGDLARYKLELDANWDPLIAHRYYKMAIAIDPNIGMPHNQLGTIAANRNYGLDAVYHFIRCVLCSEPFEGAEGNLKRAIVTYSFCTDEKCTAHQCVARLFSLLQIWEYELPNSNRINQECQDLLTNIETCLNAEQFEAPSAINVEKESSIEVYLQNCRNGPQSVHLTSDMVFKLVAICLMSISRLKSKESNEVQGVVAITLAILSQLVQFTVTRIQASLIDTTLPNMDDADNKMHPIETDDVSSDKSIIARDESIMKRLDSKLKNDNKFTDVNDNKKSFDSEQENSEKNGDAVNGQRKTREKSKSLLRKLRRRKRRNSSDSDASDADRANAGSSSDEINSDVSETEDDVLSDENALSDEALSEDGTDDEGLARAKTSESLDTRSEINGHAKEEDKEKVVDIESTANNHVDNGAGLTNELVDSKAEDTGTLTKSDDVVPANDVDPGSICEERGASVNTLTYVAQLKKESLKPDEVLDMLMGKEILASIKICCDWIRSNPDIIRICGKSSRTLLKRITVLLNLINMDADAFGGNSNEDSTILSNTEKLKVCVKKVPLPEDVDLRRLNLLEDAQKPLDWNILYKHKMNKREETLLRALKLIEFGHFLSSVEDAGIKYEQTTNLFVAIDVHSSHPAKVNGKDLEMEQLMRHMGKLWLKAEVRALESRLRSRLMSPYLVPDHEALAKHTPALKRLVYAKKFIVVIPTVVVSALDEVKRTSGRAREATRWLEAQLRRGSRFLRAQRPHERLALPLIKGPRPKDKEAWLFFQIIECCHYLTQQTKVGLVNDAEPPVVTLLSGCSADDKKVFTFSPEGLAKSAGVNIEHIESFHTKWKATSKSHG